jgi:hypothetical protein
MIQLEGINKEAADLLIKSAMNTGMVPILAKLLGAGRKAVGSIAGKVAPGLNSPVSDVAGDAYRALTVAPNTPFARVQSVAKKFTPAVKQEATNSAGVSPLEQIRQAHATRMLKKTPAGSSAQFNKKSSYNQLHVILKKAMK